MAELSLFRFNSEIYTRYDLMVFHIH